MIEVVACSAYRQLNSILDDNVETFAAIDMRVTESTKFPSHAPGFHVSSHTFDVLIVVGTGLSVEHGIEADLKVLTAEFAGGQEVTLDFNSHTVLGFPENDSVRKNINRHHGGINRPLMLLSPTPPEHAQSGYGGKRFQQWQTLALSEQVAQNVHAAKQLMAPRTRGAYPLGYALGDLIKMLATSNQIRPVWGDLRPLTRLLVNAPLSDQYFP